MRYNPATAPYIYSTSTPEAEKRPLLRMFVAYAKGYADGNAKGIEERVNLFHTVGERVFYKSGYEKGEEDFYYAMDYGMFED